MLLCFVSAVVHTHGNLALLLASLLAEMSSLVDQTGDKNRKMSFRRIAQLMKLSGVADGVLKWLQVCVCMCRYLHTCMVH
jgi:hypothetical protein